KKTLKVRCFGVNSSHSSRGFMGEAVAITSPAGYETDLKRKRILASRTKRFEHLTKELNEALKRPSAPSSDNYAGELKNFTVGICEYPRAMAGEFDKAFLMLPPEFLKVTLEFHQGCFSVNNGKLRTNKFIFVVDGTSANAAEITKNYERCVTARFKDTKFFWENDKKKKLIEYYDKLKNVNYMGKFATLYDKAERITRDASELAKIYRPAEEGEVRKTAKLLYCDIVTQIVGEFPELHGIAGQYLERSDAGSISCADSLRGAVTLDALNDISSVVGLAERLNTLKSFFYADMIPTTSKDPYGLIKSADGAVKILLTSGIDFGMKKVFEIVFDDIESGISEKIYDFLKERYKLCLVKEGIPADIANMTESKFEFPKDALALSWAVEATRKKKKEEFAYIAEAAKRIRNILRQAKKLGIKPMGVRKDLFIESEEKNLFDIAVSLRGEIELMVVKKDYISALMSLVTVKEPLDLFFEKIMVMDKDESLRDNRLGLLRDVDNLFAIFGKFDTLNALVL
ncbi:glycine--tRNA ligase subunit beta, partial [bacterium]|nr:glycine--tRNA ligase subunit beta [bacterium]